MMPYRFCTVLDDVPASFKVAKAQLYSALNYGRTSDDLQPCEIEGPVPRGELETM